MALNVKILTLVIRQCTSRPPASQYCLPIHQAWPSPPQTAENGLRLPIILMNAAPDRVTHHSIVPC